METTNTINTPVVGTEPETTTPRRKSRPRGFNNVMGEAELLAEAMTANQEALTPRGGGEEFVNRIRTAVGEAKDLNRDQERNKALQKESTAKVEAKLAELIALIREGHKIVKLGIDQKRWVEFGLRATR